jgi:catechol 2,3-dioxygenase-like lactoylglutathione lyase family enzyme
MLDHVSLAVSDTRKAKAFYDAALAAVGVTVMFAPPADADGNISHMGYGSEGRPYFWIGRSELATGRAHVAFTAATRAAVDAFHAAGLAAGGRDNGAPGLRPHYHASYYGAFVLDPDGHNIEAVCHAPT